METFDTIISYIDYLNKSTDGEGSISNGSIYYSDTNKGYYTLDYDRNRWLAIDGTSGTSNDYHSKKNPVFCPCCGAPTKPHLDNCEYCEVYFE